MEPVAALLEPVCEGSFFTLVSGVPETLKRCSQAMRLLNQRSERLSTEAGQRARAA